MKKKIFTIILALICVLASVITVFADGADIVRPSVVRKDIELVDYEFVDFPEDFDTSGWKVVVTPYAKRDDVEHDLAEKLRITIKDGLVESYIEIKSVMTLSELNSLLDEKARLIDPKYDGRIYVVRDLFDVTITDGNVKLLQTPDGSKVVCTFDINLQPDDPKPLCLHYPESKGADAYWELVADEDLVVNDDLTVTVTFDEFCPVIFVTPVIERMSIEIPTKAGKCKVMPWPAIIIGFIWCTYWYCHLTRKEKNGEATIENQFDAFEYYLLEKDKKLKG